MSKISARKELFILLFAILLLTGIYLVMKFTPVVVTVVYESSPEPAIQNIEVDDDVVNISGVFATSATFYHGYTYQLNGDELNVKLYNHMLAFSCNHHDESGDVEIRIQDDFHTLKQIYLVDNENKRLLWDREKGLVEELIYEKL